MDILDKIDNILGEQQWGMGGGSGMGGGRFTGWNAKFGSSHVFISTSDAKDLEAAKKYAYKKLKVPKGREEEVYLMGSRD